MRPTLHTAVDCFYGKASAVAKIEFVVKDVISFDQSERGMPCKAIGHLGLAFIGVAQAVD